MNMLRNDIISVFVNRRALELSDADIHRALIEQGISCSTGEVEREVVSLTPTLFQRQRRGPSTFVQVHPQIEICEDFLRGNCHRNLKRCDKLHICRHFNHCKKSGCGFPHDFSHGYNQVLVRNNGLQDVRDDLVVKLLQLKNPPRIPPTQRNNPRRGGRVGSIHSDQRPTYSASSAPDQSSYSSAAELEDIDRQIHVTYPLNISGDKIDTELIELLLEQKKISIEKAIEQSEGRYFGRLLLQLKSPEDVEKAVAQPIINYAGNEIKLKRAKKPIDRSSFLLKVPITRPEEKIADPRFKLYVQLLVGSGVNVTLTDASIDAEQICLVECNHELDFEKVCQEYKSRSTMQGRPISFAQIFQFDTICIRSQDGRRSIQDINPQHIFSSHWQNIFDLTFPDAQSAEVEFINNHARKEWMTHIETITKRFELIVEPFICEVEEQSEETERVPVLLPTQRRQEPTTAPKADSVTITLKPTWELIASHPLFRDELIAYFKTQLGGQVQLSDNELIYSGPLPPPNLHMANSHAIIMNKTNNFMQTFKVETLRNLRPQHMQILRAHSAIVVWKREHQNDYLAGAKHDNMRLIKSKLFPPRPAPNPPSNLEKNPTFTRSPLSMSLESLTSTTSTGSIPTPPLLFPVASLEQVHMLNIVGFEDLLQQYLQDTYYVTSEVERSPLKTDKEKVQPEKMRIIIKINGSDKEKHEACEYLHALFLTLRTHTFDEKNHGTWTKLDGAISIIQYHCKQHDWICSCQRTNPTSIRISHFGASNPQFGFDETKLFDLINNKFSGATTVLPSGSISESLVDEWDGLQKKIEQQENYHKDICLHRERQSIYLFGLVKLVKDLHEQFETLKKRFDLQPLKLKLSDAQFKYLTHIAKQQLSKLEKEWKKLGCEFNLSLLRQQGEIHAPVHVHDKIRDDLETLAKIESLPFEIRNGPFIALIEQKPETLLSLVKGKCYLEKKIRTERVPIPIPRAKVADAEDGMAAQQEKPADSSRARIDVGQSSIEIVFGDLAKQKVDVIVVNMTSEILSRAIVSAAGPSVEQEFSAMRVQKNPGFFTSNGNLPCKRILFLNMDVNPSNSEHFQQSLQIFIRTAIQNTTKNRFQSLAFPSVGAGKFNIDPQIVAKAMIEEAYSQLATNDKTLDVFFVLLPDQKAVYDAFVQHLRSLPASVINARTKTQPKSKATVIQYDQKILELTLISSNQLYLGKCRADIEDLAKCILTSTTLTGKRELLDWSQETIVAYYKYCLAKEVVPKIDMEALTIELQGSKDAVSDVERRFYQLTTETLQEARLRAVARGIIWSFEKTPGSDVWEQYSFKIIGELEDARQKKLPHLDFTNEQDEACRVTFSTMEERCQDRRRRVRRNEANLAVPSHWEASDQNCKRVVLPKTSTEYQTVLDKFNTTMQNRYTQIVQIERIQNERWYKQYVAHRDEYRKRHATLDEQTLFHGCTNDSADKIITECFNRSFAGVNGVAFGQGVYFHTDANYSHNYARPGPTGSRTMFLARVLIGKPTMGNPNMKVPPAGFDTTTDGKGIFVVYHDAASYAEYLITYK